VYDDIVRKTCAFVVVLGWTIGCSLLTNLSDLEDASSDAAFESGSDALADGGRCTGTHGATSVVIDNTYCVDSTEITIDDFQLFLTSVKGNVADYLPESGTCSTVNGIPGNWGTQHNPYDGGPPLGSAAAGGLNWCSVYAYCAWAGKRMCGAVGGGGMLDIGQVDNAAVSEWFNACSHGNDQLHKFAYGIAYDASACAVDDAGASYPLPVASYPGCVGGYDGLFDMSGNVAEWTNECTFDACAAPGCCAVRAPGVGFPGTFSSCDSTQTEGIGAGSTFTFGGRCCSDLK
jgi:formylglycine-generating enzyme required for sulfatase activity